MTKGRIVGFAGSHGSGLAQLLVMTENGIEAPAVDNGTTVRSLVAAYGDDVIGEGHTVNNEALYDKPIEFSTDGIMMTGFNVPEDDDPDLPNHLLPKDGPAFVVKE